MRKSGVRRTRRPSFEDRHDRQTPDTQRGPKTSWPPHPQHSHQPADVHEEVAEETTSTVADMPV
jgi:hypothetical protein